MNPDQPSRDQIETRITALLLGELPANEAELLRYTISRDPALQKLHDQLQSTLALVREAEKHPAEPPAEKPAPLKLSDDRRQKLLEHFKTVRPEVPQDPLFWLKRIKVRQLVTALVVAALLGIVAAFLLPVTRRERMSIDTQSDEETARLAADSGLSQAEKSVIKLLAESPAPPARSGLLTNVGIVTLGNTVIPGHGEDLFVGGVTTASSPVPAALPPEPQLTPPPAPVQIVLPQTESAPETASAAQPTAGLLSPQEIAGHIVAPGTTNVYSQNVVGYSTLATTPPPATAAEDTFALQTADSEAVLRQDNKIVASQLLQNAKDLYEEGKLNEAQASLKQAGALDPNNNAVAYYQNLINQNETARLTPWHNTDTQERHERVERQWIPPVAAPGSSNEVTSTPGNFGGFGGGGIGGGGGFGGAPAGGVYDNGLSTDGTTKSTFADNISSDLPATAGPNSAIRNPQSAIESPETTTISGRSAFQPAAKVPDYARNPIGAFPGAPPVATGTELAANEPQSDESGRRYTTATRERGTDSATLHTFYRNPTQPGEEKKIPIAGDVPVVGSLFQSSADMPASSPAVTANGIMPPPPSDSTNSIAMNWYLGRNPDEPQSAAVGGSVPAQMPRPAAQPQITANLEPLMQSSQNNNAAVHLPWGGKPPSGVAGTQFEFTEQERLPGVAGSVYEDSDENRRLIEAERQREIAEYKSNASNHGFFTPNSAGGGTNDAGMPLNLATLDSDKAKLEPQEQPEGQSNPFIARNAYIAFPSTNYLALDDSGGRTASIGSPAGEPAPKSEPNSQVAVSGETMDLNAALDRYAQLTGRTILRSSLPSGGKISIDKSLSKEDQTAALQAALALNGVSTVNIGGQFVKAVPSDEASTAGAGMDLNKGLAVNESVNNGAAQNIEDQAMHVMTKSQLQDAQAYDSAKRGLEQKLAMNQLVYSRLEAEKIDTTLPKSSMVQITDPAEPARNQTFWQRLTGQYQSTARIKVENDVTDIPGISGASTVAYGGYDPYFIQTTFEIMQSEKVLGKVVDALNLQSAWATSNGGEKLSRTQAIEKLKQRLELNPVKNTELLTISVTDGDPKEAADIANGIAKAYTDYRIESRRALTTNGLAVLEQQYDEQEHEIQTNQAYVEQLRQQLQTGDAPEIAQYISEVIPIRYAKADDIASALNTLSNAGGRPRAPVLGQSKIITDEKSGSLLIYASRSDMDTIKGIVAKLDTQDAAAQQSDLPLRKPAPNTPVPQPEILTSSNNFSTFSMNVSDVSFKFAEASLENNKLPDTASIRSEEFVNAFDYRDPEAAPGQPMAFNSELALYPFNQNRELLRFSVKAAASGRQAGRALNLVLLLDTSGSMERADRVEIIREALRVLSAQLQPNDIVSVVSFARTARLWADGISGDKAGETLGKVGSITPEGGTNLEEAMRLAYETARRHYLANGMNRVVLLTDGAANLGNVDPTALEQKVDAQRKQGIALDCFGIGWEDYNDDLLEELSSNGDGRYAFLNSPEDAAKDFGTKLAGALQVAAQDLKVQVEFNPQRVTAYRQIGYAKHQLTKEQFRDNTVAAGEIASQEAGNALYTIETNPNGDGPIATVHVRYRVPGTQDYREHSWDVPYTGHVSALDQSSPAMRLAAAAAAFSEWLAASPYAQEVTPDDLLKYLTGVPEIYGADDRPKQLETMIREAKSLEGK